MNGTQQSHESESGFQAALQQAGKERKVVLAFFSKLNCIGCHDLEMLSMRDQAVQAFIEEHCVVSHLILNDPSDSMLFRQYQVIWTPSLLWLDRRGVAHYRSEGFLPAKELLAVLRIGVARSKLAWARYQEVDSLLSAVAEDQSSPYAAEALFYLGMAHYLHKQSHEALMQIWRRLRAEHPTSPWTARIPPHQGE